MGNRTWLLTREGSKTSLFLFWNMHVVRAALDRAFVLWGHDSKWHIDVFNESFSLISFIFTRFRAVIAKKMMIKDDKHCKSKRQYIETLSLWPFSWLFIWCLICGDIDYPSVSPSFMWHWCCGGSNIFQLLLEEILISGALIPNGLRGRLRWRLIILTDVSFLTVLKQ